MFAYCDNNPVLCVDYNGKVLDVLIEQGIELFQQLIFWWESGGREAVIETAEAVGTLIVLIIVEDVAADALDTTIVDSKTKTASGSQAKTTLSTSTPATPPNNNNNERKFNVNKSESPQWKKLKTVKGSNLRTSGSGSKQLFYEWDYTHNDIEVYNSNGVHLGSMDPVTGEMYKPAVPGRVISVP